MLKDDLYIIKKSDRGTNFINAVIQLNEQHEIFKGHFPSQAVLPGACMLQMIKEILEISVHKKLQLSKANDIKFLSVIRPTGLPLHCSIQYNSTTEGSINIVAKITENEVVCCKIKASFQTK